MVDQSILGIQKAITCFQFSEKIKSELLIASKLLWIIEDLKGEELTGAKKLMFAYVDALSAEIRIAYNVVNLQDFEKAGMKVTEMKEKIDSNEYQEATKCVSEAISFVTTCGQRAAERLKEKGLF